MTDLASAATCLSNIKCAARDTVMAHFYEKHAKGSDLILCKWLAISASACTDDALVCVTEDLCVCMRAMATTLCCANDALFAALSVCTDDVLVCELNSMRMCMCKCGVCVCVCVSLCAPHLCLHQ